MADLVRLNPEGKKVSSRTLHMLLTTDY